MFIAQNLLTLPTFVQLASHWDIRNIKFQQVTTSCMRQCFGTFMCFCFCLNAAVAKALCLKCLTSFLATDDNWFKLLTYSLLLTANYYMWEKQGGWLYASMLGFQSSSHIRCNILYHCTHIAVLNIPCLQDLLNRIL